MPLGDALVLPFVAAGNGAAEAQAKLVGPAKRHKLWQAEGFCRKFTHEISEKLK
jgi:hypothetical protein